MRKISANFSLPGIKMRATGIFWSVIIAILWVISIVGWVMNFENLFAYSYNTQEFIISAIGIFAYPLGIFTGFYF